MRWWDYKIKYQYWVHLWIPYVGHFPAFSPSSLTVIRNQHKNVNNENSQLESAAGPSSYPNSCVRCISANDGQDPFPDLRAILLSTGRNPNIQAHWGHLTWTPHECLLGEVFNVQIGGDLKVDLGHMEEILSNGFEKSRLQSSSWIANRRRPGCFHLMLRKKACILL